SPCSGCETGHPSPPFALRSGDNLYVPRTPRSGVTASALRAYARTPTANGLTAYRMRLHLACVSSGTYGPFATSAS
ncbi:MAG: hypothetical protein, partial [Olavius algarvensis Gamma 1 endosymbiont]